MTETASVRRGDYKLILSQSLLLNDFETGVIEFYFSGNAKAKITIEFEPMNNPPKHPSIEITGSKYTKKMKFFGWNSPLAYSTDKPMKLFDLVGPEAVFFSICNEHMGNTNKLYIEIYLTE